MKQLKIEKAISKCQDCLYMNIGSSYNYCNHENINGDDNIFYEENILENCPLPDIDQNNNE